jgi:NADH dehydrogenase/NADH:ubiquinone oxidoreductase subunit G
VAREHLARWTAAELEEASGVGAAPAAAVVEALGGEGSAAVLLASEFGASERLDLVSGLAALLAEATGARFLAMLEGADSNGVRGGLAAAGYPGRDGLTTPEQLEAAVRGDVRALLVFGADPIAAFPGTIAAQAVREAALVVVSAPLPGPAVEAADVVLPAAVFGEKGGSVVGAFGATARLEPALAPPGRALPDLAILEGMRAALASIAAPERRRPAAAGAPAHGFFAELDLFLRTGERDAASRGAGSHLLLAEASATNAAEGSLTGQLSWARYAYPEALLGISAAHAGALGVRAGDRVRVRSNWGETVLRVRVDGSLPEGVVTAPHRDPAVRALLRWRREPTLRCLDLRPDHVSLEALTGAERA